MSSQTKSTPAYPFLSQPPPQKKRPTQPLPSPPTQSHVLISPCVPALGRRRSATTSAIAAWISNVQPGSPAPVSPCSPHRRSSVSPRSPSRRPSVISVRVPSASFLSLTPTTPGRITPLVKDFKPDLVALGYTSVFVHFPNTPVSSAQSAFPDRRLSPAFALPTQTPSTPPARGLKRFRSLSVLKSRSRSKSTTMPPPSAPKAPKVPPIPAHARAENSAAVSKSKKTKYAKYRPPPLAAELALAQFADGGKMDDHVKHFLEAQARAAGATVVNGQLVGVGDVWRDGDGGVWRDQDEEWEYAHLLGGDDDFCSSEAGWVRFSTGSGAKGTPADDDEERRGSVSSQDSDLDPRYAMQPEAESGSHDDLAVFGGTLPPAALRKPGMSVLAIPARSRRAAKHLRKPEFLLDVFPARRRPAPLMLPPPSPTIKCPTNPLDDVRKDFLESSFAPAPASPARAPVLSTSSSRTQTQPHADRAAIARKMALKPSALKMDMRGLFRVMGGKKADI
ncbi:hypothetical protein B0H21DRAFT_719616 [Amylocystis lapponica]|nr:hypothetical protein B0H21DRAFT_719616 [Amylocystis lapponica]